MNNQQDSVQNVCEHFKEVSISPSLFHHKHVRDYHTQGKHARQHVHDPWKLAREHVNKYIRPVCTELEPLVVKAMSNKSTLMHRTSKMLNHQQLT